MARIPEELIERIKREVPLRQLAEDADHKLTRKGKDWVCLCPFHKEDTPSCHISEAKNCFHCFGCGKKGSVFDWVILSHGVSFRHACELLRAKLPDAATTPIEPKPIAAADAQLRSPVDFDADDRALLKQVVAFYHQALLQDAKCLAYLEKRGLHSPDLIRRFQLGYADRTLGYRLPDKGRKAGAAIRGRLGKLGIYRASGHEHFNGSLVIPVFDEHGDVATLYGRKITPQLRDGTPLHLYLPGPHRGVFNLTALKAYRQVILCEALLDALTFFNAGFENVTSSYGANGFTDEHLEAMQRFGVERVLIAYDRDEGGDRGADLVAKKLLAQGIGCYRIEFPHGMDANEFALKLTPARKSLEMLIRKASWMGNGQSPAPAPAPDLLIKEATKKEALPSVAASPAEPTPHEPLSTPEPRPASNAIPVLAANDHEVVVQIGDRRYRVRGLPKTAHGSLAVTVVATRTGEDIASSEQSFFADRLDLCIDKQRTAFAHQAAAELQLEETVIKKDLGKLFLQLEAFLDRELAKSLLPPPAVKLSDEETAAATVLLEDPKLLERIVGDFDRCGVVGEESNKLVGYLAAVSRKLNDPLAIIIQSSSAAGKSSLMEAILAFVPDEDQKKYSAMTGQSLFYVGETSLSHKVLAVVEEEGAERASYALKLLQSEGELTIASTGKDPKTGRLETTTYRVEGPVMILITTTAAEVDEELLNRCIVLTVNEEREQTRAIHRRQRESQTLEGQLAKRERDQLLQVHRNAQRLLRPLVVVNRFAPALTFLDSRIRTRRDHMKYLTLIRTIALLHQYQRPHQTATTKDGKTFTYIEVTPEDIAIANRLAAEVLGRSLDELAPQTRRLLSLLDEMVTRECKPRKMKRADFRFSRREIREKTGWSLAQLHRHLARLVEHEYLIVHRGGRGQSFVYELVYSGDGAGEGKPGEAFLMGLLDVGQLQQSSTTTDTITGEVPTVAETSAGITAQLLPDLHRIADRQSAVNPSDHKSLPRTRSTISENAHLEAAEA